MKRALALLCASVVFCAVGMAEAGKIFFNKKEIDPSATRQLAGQRFEPATVWFDAAGNVHIEVKGYDIQVRETAPPAPPAQPARLTQRYFVVAERARPGMSQYDVQIFVNSRYVGTFKSAGTDMYFEVTDKLVPGNNLVQFVAKKNLEGGRRSVSPGDTLRITLGEGTMDGRNIILQRSLYEYARSAADMGDDQGYHRFVPR